MLDNFPSKNEIENFIINNSNISNIEAHLNKFNPIRVMQMENMEIRHSAILGWLLNPMENHGLGDWFLKAFLTEALKGVSYNTSALEVQSVNLMDANVFVEWNNIDIFIEVPNQKWAFIVENKIEASQSHNQLKKYRAFVEEYYKGSFKISGVFLTLYNESPDDDYSTIRYSDVYELIEMLLHQNKDTLSEKVYNFIGYYQETIGRKCGMDSELVDMKNLAKQIYREHKSVIDFIYEHGKSTQFQYAVSQLVDGEIDKNNQSFTINDVKYRYFASNQNVMSFLPEKWIEILGELNHDQKGNINANEYPWSGCEKWWWKYPVICWFELNEKSIRIYAEVGPLSSFDLRKKLINSIEKVDTGKIKFSDKSKMEGAKYSKFLAQNKGKFSSKINENDIDDAEAIKAKFDALLIYFNEHVVEQISESLTDFINEMDLSEAEK
jgi:hypothetical protein